MNINYSIIVPILNEVALIERCYKNIMSNFSMAELIFVDGGSEDGTLELLTEFEDIVLVKSEQGRGEQFFEGARKAKGAVLIFLHVDTLFYSGCEYLLDELFLKKEINVATLKINFDGHGMRYRFFEWAAQFETLFTTYGDQVYVIKKNFYDTTLQMPRKMIFEDVEYMRRARRVTKVKKLPINIVSSVRKYEKSGYFKNNLKNINLFIAYLLGVSDEVLYKKYYSE